MPNEIKIISISVKNYKEGDFDSIEKFVEVIAERCTDIIKSKKMRLDELTNKVTKEVMKIIDNLLKNPYNILRIENYLSIHAIEGNKKGDISERIQDVVFEKIRLLIVAINDLAKSDTDTQTGIVSKIGKKTQGKTELLELLMKCSVISYALCK